MKSINLRKDLKGFTLVELLVYVAIFAIVAGMLTTIFFLIVNSQKKQSVSSEVNQQLNFVLGTVQRLVGESSLVETVYEGSSPSSACTTFCTLKLRRTDPTKDPTVISSDAAGVYLQEGGGAQVTLTTNKVLVNHLRLTKHEIPGGHAVVEISTSFAYNTVNPSFAVTRAIESAIARVNAATFDADLLPNQDSTFDIGQASPGLRWRSGRFSNDLTIGGNVGIGTTSPDTKLHIIGGVKIVDGGQGANKVLTSDANGVGSWQTPAGIPTGAVMFFNLASCPTGWTELTAARGRTVVGLPSGGTLAGTAGTALSNLENRAAGEHYHGLVTADTGRYVAYPANLNHLFPTTDGGRSTNILTTINPGTSFIGTQEGGTNYSAGGPVLISGTNAPYIQLLTCQKS